MQHDDTNLSNFLIGFKGVITWLQGTPQEDEYSLTVSATSNTDTTSTDFIVFLNDLNDNAPVFGGCNDLDATVSEAAENGDFVIQVIHW